MNNIEQIVQTFKKLEKSSISFDTQGRLLIKPPSYSLPNQTIKKDKDQLSIVQHTDLFLNSLLHPEDRVPRKNLSIWIDELIKETDTFSEQHRQVKALSIATVFNQAALALCLMGNVKIAQRLCEKQMDIFHSLSKESPGFLKYVIQPWINLGRVDRIIKAFDQSLEKFKALNFVHGFVKTIRLGKYSLNGDLLIEEIHSDQEIYSITSTCAFLEPIKTYLSAALYSELIDFLNQEVMWNNSILLGIAYEASIIAHLYQNMLPDAIRLVNEALIKAPPYLMPIFLLRQGSLYAIGHDSRAEVAFNQILDYIDYCDIKTISIHQAIFSAKAAGQFLRFSYTKLAKKAYQKALLLCETVDDEMCTIECLEALDKLSTDKKYTSQLKQMAHHSGYAPIIQRYAPDKNSSKLLLIKTEILFAKLMSMTIQEIRRVLDA